MAHKALKPRDVVLLKVLLKKLKIIAHAHSLTQPTINSVMVGVAGLDVHLLHWHAQSYIPPISKLAFGTCRHLLATFPLDLAP